ncbi:ArsR family transcriptional regulator [Paenibacillus sp. GSMTC-2017]|uniref:ATP-binding protein n=1 Tax=Paenibacillus sp. GSMTC-2017 TaxID=2794350 RepID=UPI0018D67B77|nr:ATP-binding protein [Paenibacillus sp. GSMTC-2017]MBH5318566.1 ArsR family transcriptional regulator [Paenibacillus sp. GSMTC-2017]
MATTRDYGVELDSLAGEVNELKQLLLQFIGARSANKPSQLSESRKESFLPDAIDDLGAIFYSGQHRGTNGFRWEPQQRRISKLLELDSDKGAKVLAALGNKQRLDILTTVLRGPLTGTEIVEQLNMGTTGQLYHHTKALLGADLLVQEERGGRYSLPPHRTLPLLLLLSAISDLVDTSNYIELSEARNQASSYLGESSENYDPNHLLWAVLENSVLEHEAGYCSEVTIILQNDRSVTVADNGRGIPIQALSNSTPPPLQSIFTEIGRFNKSATIVAPGGIKGINMPIVNALSERLSVEVRREGKVFRQDFKHGIPQSELHVIGVTKETGTSVTFKPDQEIIVASFDREQLMNRVAEYQGSFPNLRISVLE